MKPTMSKTKPAPKTRRRKTTHTFPPLELFAIAALIGEHHRPEELTWALDVARRALQPTSTDYSDVVHHAISQSAAHGTFRAAVAAVRAWDEDQLGDLHNAYGLPALHIGLALGWLLLGRGTQVGAR